MTFFEDNSFSQQLGVGRESYIDGSSAYMEVTVDAPSDIVLIVCHCFEKVLNTFDHKLLFINLQRSE